MLENKSTIILEFLKNPQQTQKWELMSRIEKIAIAIKQKVLRICFYNYLGWQTLKNWSGMPIPPILRQTQDHSPCSSTHTSIVLFRSEAVKYLRLKNLKSSVKEGREL